MDDCARKICPLPTLGAGREGAAAVASAAAASVAAARSAILTGSNSLPARRQNDASAGAAPLHAVPYHPAASTKLVAQAAETAETEVCNGPANGSGVEAVTEGAHTEAPGARVAEGALEQPAAAEPAAPALQDQADQAAPTPPSSSPGLSGLSSVQQERAASVTAPGAHPEASGARACSEGALEEPAATGHALQDHAEPTRPPGSSPDLFGLSSVQQERVTSVTAVVRCDDATAAIQLLAHSRPASLHTTQVHCQEHDIKAGEDQDTPALEAHQQLLPPQVDSDTKKLQLQQKQQKSAPLRRAQLSSKWRSKRGACKSLLPTRGVWYLRAVSSV